MCCGLLPFRLMIILFCHMGAAAANFCVVVLQDLTLLGPGGRAMVVGNRGSVEINPRDLMGGEKDVRGYVLF